MVEKQSFHLGHVFDYSVEIAVGDIFTLLFPDFPLLIEQVHLDIYFAPPFEYLETVREISFFESFVRSIDRFAERMKKVTYFFSRTALLLFLVPGIAIERRAGRLNRIERSDIANVGSVDCVISCHGCSPVMVTGRQKSLFVVFCSGAAYYQTAKLKVTVRLVCARKRKPEHFHGTTDCNESEERGDGFALYHVPSGLLQAHLFYNIYK